MYKLRCKESQGTKNSVAAGRARVRSRIESARLILLTLRGPPIYSLKQPRGVYRERERESQPRDEEDFINALLSSYNRAEPMPDTRATAAARM